MTKYNLIIIASFSIVSLSTVSASQIGAGDTPDTAASDLETGRPGSWPQVLSPLRSREKKDPLAAAITTKILGFPTETASEDSQGS